MPKPPESPTITQAARSIAAMDLDTLLRVWRNRGGSSREFLGGDIELLHPNGERAMRGARADVEAWLREQLQHVEVLA